MFCKRHSFSPADQEQSAPDRGFGAGCSENPLAEPGVDGLREWGSELATPG